MFAINNSGTLTGPHSAAAVQAILNIGFDPNAPGDLSMHGVYPYPAIAAPKPGQTIDTVTLSLSRKKVKATVQYRALDADELDDLRAARLAELNAVHDQHMRKGWAHDFGGENGVHTLDYRPGTEDRANWTALLLETNAVCAAGRNDDPCTLMTADNATITITAEQANSAMCDLAAWANGCRTHKWTLRDQINAASGYDAIMAVELDRGWPA